MPADFEVPVVFIANAEDDVDARRKVSEMLFHMETLDQLMPYMVKRGTRLPDVP